MVGCMLESSALIAAGAVIAQRTDYADLDGAWLIGDDPFRGWQFDRGILHPPSMAAGPRRRAASRASFPRPPIDWPETAAAGAARL